MWLELTYSSYLSSPLFLLACWSHFPDCQPVLFRVRLYLSNLTTLTWKWPAQEVRQKSIKRSLTWSWRADNSIPDAKCKNLRPLSACQLQVRAYTFFNPPQAHVIRNRELRFRAFYFLARRTEAEKLIVDIRRQVIIGLDVRIKIPGCNSLPVQFKSRSLCAIYVVPINSMFCK